MQEVTIKKDKNIILDNDIKLFLNPKFAFLPINTGFKLKVKDGDYVYKNDIVAMDNRGHIVSASISGKVLGIKKMDYYRSKNVPSLVIENDFKENIRAKKSAKKYINDYTKDEFLQTLSDASYVYKGKYLVEKFTRSSEVIIINGVELDPYFGNKYFILRDSIEDILETCDFVAEIMNASKVYFVVKNIDSELISTITSLLGTYPNIELKLIGEAYPNGMGELQKRYFQLEEAEVIDVEEVMAVFDILKRERPITSKYITVTGSAVKPKTVIRVKIGTLLSEVFVHNFDFVAPKVDVYINGTLYGTKVDTLKWVVDSDIDGIFILEKNEIKEEACLNCGQCSKTCPVGLNPKFVFDHDGNVKAEYYDKCLQCGLCNYVCPANRDLKSRMKGRDSP